MRVAGRLAAQVLEMIGPYVREGISTDELNDICHDYIVNKQQSHSCSSPLQWFSQINLHLSKPRCCHGIPGPERLNDGDIINIDVTVIKEGYHGDTSKMFMVGEPSKDAIRLINLAQECLYLGIEQIKPGARLGDIGHAIQSHAEYHRLSVVREYCGHGIGTAFQEEPQILHFGRPGTGDILLPGMTFTIEPIINLGKSDTRLLPDEWTVVTKDRRLSAQWNILCWLRKKEWRF